MSYTSDGLVVELKGPGTVAFSGYSTPTTPMPLPGMTIPLTGMMRLTLKDGKLVRLEGNPGRIGR
jgi:hypothetical protein